MVNLKREGVSLLAKLARAIFTSTNTTEETEEAERTEEPELLTVNDLKAEPMTDQYWETEKQSNDQRNQHFVNSYLKRIPDTTEEAVKESHYKFAKLHLFNVAADLQYRTEYPKIGNVF